MDGLIVPRQAGDLVGVLVPVAAVAVDQVELLAFVAAHIAHRQEMGVGRAAVELPHLLLEESELAGPFPAGWMDGRAPHLEHAADVAEKGNPAAIRGQHRSHRAADIQVTGEIGSI